MNPLRIIGWAFAVIIASAAIVSSVVAGCFLIGLVEAVMR